MKPIVLIIIILSFSGVVHAQDPVASAARSDAPIEITADDLIVKRANELAVFKGDVEAVQADLTLRSDKMTVYYRSGAKRTAGQNTISRIDVDGNVFLATPEETARGEEGVYNVDKKRITMDGNVVLTRQQNVVTGNKLIYEIDSGRSQLFSDVATPQTPGEVAPAAGKKKRVKALFVPEGSKDKEEPKQ